MYICREDYEESEMIFCPKKHGVCLNCFRTSVEMKLGNGITSTLCVGGCEEEYEEVCSNTSLSILRFRCFVFF
jgi:hypothetical protein